jgi:hypothetical protein
MTISLDTRPVDIVIPATSGAHITTIECNTWMLCQSKPARLPTHNHSASYKASGKDERERYRPLHFERMATMPPLEDNP